MDKQNLPPLNDDVHQVALAALIHIVFGISQDRSALTQALQHIYTCSHCQRSLSEWSQALTGRLSARQLQGWDSMEVDADLFDWLLDTLADRDLDRILDKSSLASYPDFGQWRLMQKTVPQGTAEHSAKLRRGAGYLAWLMPGVQEQVVAALISIKDILEQPPALVLAHRSGDAESLLSFALMDEPQLQAQLTVYLDRASALLCWAIVEVVVPDRWPDSSGVEVVMRLPDREESKLTSKTGQVIFQNIPRNELAHTTFLLVMPPEGARPT